MAVALIAAATAVATFQLWKPGVPSPVDLICAVYRAFELEQSIAGGVLFPRVGMGLNFGYSAPLFEFYAPLASYATLFVHWAGLGYVEAAKAVFVAALFVGALGAYVYARWLFGSRLPALVSGAAFLFAPYLLTNAYQRGALAESLALSLLPWLFWTFHRLLTSGDRHWVFPSATVLALLILSHNITAMFVVVFLAGSIGWQALRTRSWGRLPWLVRLPCSGWPPAPSSGCPPSPRAAIQWWTASWADARRSGTAWRSGPPGCSRGWPLTITAICALAWPWWRW